MAKCNQLTSLLFKGLSLLHDWRFATFSSQIALNFTSNPDQMLTFQGNSAHSPQTIIAKWFKRADPIAIRNFQFCHQCYFFSWGSTSELPRLHPFFTRRVHILLRGTSKKFRTTRKCVYISLLANLYISGHLFTELTLADPGPEFGAWWARTYNGVNALLHYHKLRSRPICPEICFCKQKKSSDVWGHGPWPPGSASELSGPNCTNTSVCQMTVPDLYSILFF